MRPLQKKTKGRLSVTVHPCRHLKGLSEKGVRICKSS